MKHNAILVNCARPAIVDKKAVLQAIKEKRLFGYGVETEIMQPLPKGDEYFQYPNIIATPHNAFITIESNVKTIDITIQNIEAFLSGKLINQVV